MKDSFRQSMSWLHTWGGLVVSWVLYFIFVTGAAGYFYIEIDHWMRPEIPMVTNVTEHGRMLALVERRLMQRAPDAKFWWIYLPSDRDPLFTIYWEDA